MNTEIEFYKNKVIEQDHKINDLENKLKQFLDVFYRTNFADKEVKTKDLVMFKKDLIFEGESRIKINSTTGLKIGTNTSEKIGFFGQSPVVRQSATDITSVINALKKYGLLS